MIDAALFLIGRLSERGRVHRLVRSIQASPTRERALALINRELDDRIPKFVRPEIRATLDQEVLDRLRETKLTPNRVTAEDLWAAFAVFWLVFLTALPAVVPFLIVRDPLIALRASNAVLHGLLFYIGWRWAEYTGGIRWLTGLCMTLIGTLLVVIAIALGG